MPTPEDLDSAARLVGEDTSPELLAGQLSGVVQRFTAEPALATRLNAELQALTDRYGREGLPLTDTAFVLAAHVNAIATTLQDLASKQHPEEPRPEACAQVAMAVFGTLREHAPTMNAMFLVLAQMTNSCLASSAVEEQRRAAEERGSTDAR